MNINDDDVKLVIMRALIQVHRQAIIQFEKETDPDKYMEYYNYANLLFHITEGLLYNSINISISENGATTERLYL